MNETIKTIFERRSTRGFKPDQIDKETLDTIIQSGLIAPSAMNTQNWHFTVVQNGELIEKINSACVSELPEDFKERMRARNNGSDDFSVFYNSPTIVVVSAVSGDNWSQINCALATQNICLAAHSLGVSSCIIGMVTGLFNSPQGEEYLKLLKIPEGYSPMYAISLGYKAVEMEAPSREPDKVTYIV